MADTTLDVETTPQQLPTVPEEEIATPKVRDKGTKIHTEKVYIRAEEKPMMGEVLGWFFYGFCSYFVHTVLIPVVLPLIISQVSAPLPLADPAEGLVLRNGRGLVCGHKELHLYQSLTNTSITINNMSLTPLEGTSISWALGLIISAPIMSLISVHLDYGPYQQLIAAAATGLGALFCLPAGFFRTTYIFLPYVIVIVTAATICSATHTRHLGLMVRGFIGSPIGKKQFPDRRAVTGWLSLYSTAAGCLGAAVIAAFAYHMLSHPEKILSLWIVSIFSGLIWAAGIIHVFTGYRAGVSTSSSNPIPKRHAISIFKFPHAGGSLAGVFLSSLCTMCIFTGSLLYLMGQLCIKPTHLLFLWLTYFIFPLLSLPIIQPFQNLIRADAVKMQLLGFLLSIFTSGVGYYYRQNTWSFGLLLVFSAIQGTGTGVLHAFARVLLLDCSPPGKEGVFAAWFSWVRAVGACLGFVFASSWPGSLGKSLGVSFWCSIVGVVVLIFGNMSSFGGAVAAGHVREYNEKGSSGLDHDSEITSESYYEVKLGA